MEKNILGGDGKAYTLKDVYGLNSTLEVWYVDNDGKTYGKAPENLKLDELEKEKTYIDDKDYNYQIQYDK